MLTTQIGEISTWDKVLFINWSIKLALPFVNNYLSMGIQLPDTFFGMVRIKEALFTAMEGYV